MGITDSARPDFDSIIKKIAKYALKYEVKSHEAYETARYCFMDSLGCALLALNYQECTKLLGPVVPGAIMKNGCRVPGTKYQLDPVQAAFNIGTMVRWLDYNDTWLAAEWGHPSDNLGAILAIADFLNQKGQEVTMKDVLSAMIKAHEIQGILTLENSFNKVGLDHVLLVRIASTAIATAMLGGNLEQIQNALTLAWADGGALRTYRHAPNTGSRKSWAAGDASSRAVRLAFIAMTGEMGYPSVMTAEHWGFQDVLFKGKKIKLSQKMNSYVMENILFKISYPAEFHAQTAVECALKLYDSVKDKLSDIKTIYLETQESGYRIINKTGKLDNPADRDHCLQYMVAIPLIYGQLTADHYEDKIAANPKIDELRSKMVCAENESYTKDYLDPDKRSIANSIQIEFNDGSKSKKVEIHYPVGHRKRRSEGIPLLINKFHMNIKTRMSKEIYHGIESICASQEHFENKLVDEVMNLICREN
ncbi:MAG: bifunctional 2-methylcitrate dehydratase/aconitate hydratase [Lentisphaerales bacterium]|nr:bifunctional 2-methylcitrate dehydratase/aconitate hydratase [Lentisphaerales bacterium]